MNGVRGVSEAVTGRSLFVVSWPCINQRREAYASKCAQLRDTVPTLAHGAYLCKARRMSKTIKEWTEYTTRVNEANGWGDDDIKARPWLDDPSRVATAARAVVEKLALIHTEVSEAIECVRDAEFMMSVVNGKPEGLPSELADVVFRVLHLADMCGIDLESVMERKMQYNETREYRHGGRLM